MFLTALSVLCFRATCTTQPAHRDSRTLRRNCADMDGKDFGALCLSESGSQCLVWEDHEVAIPLLCAVATCVSCDDHTHINTSVACEQKQEKCGLHLSLNFRATTARAELTRVVPNLSFPSLLNVQTGRQPSTPGGNWLFSQPTALDKFVVCGF